MRLLFISQDFPPAMGGIQTYTAELAPRLADRCERFLLIAPSHPRAEAFDATLDYEVHRLPIRPDLLVLRAIPHVIRIARRERFDMAFHVQWPTAFSSLLSKLVTGYPRHRAISLHGKDAVFHPFGLETLNRGYDALRRLALASANGVLPVSRFLAERGKELGVAPDAIHVIPNGTNPEVFYPEAVPDLRRTFDADDHPIVFSAGRLVPKKGFDTAIRAMEQVADAIPSARLLIAGSGPEEDRLHALTRQLNLHDQVRFLGPIPHHKLRRYYNLADVFLMAGHEVPGDVEGFGLVYLEANACGTPVIGSRVGGVPDAIRHEETGLLVPPRHPTATAQAVIRLLRDEALARRLGEQGRQRVLNEATWDHIADRVYRALRASMNLPSIS
jgi:phosphatidylinositol alpha-1,6-mannosyltransferase